ncbi:uncharacterized protein [Chelonus insularis]|uniref:uncharacterized protein n=1 Tax=Chelonus insularis TaxID=460826 RepID=UPI00158917D5|nr:uncharacterized protein LOC118066618 [Chelonus insularis]
MICSVAHKLNTKHRTKDVITSDNTTFYHMGLSPEILEGLTNCGFEKPSPIQLTAIPLGRCGVDLIIQAKSGTGKTAVFGIIALDMVYVKDVHPQVLILAPTREIAIQISQVLASIGSEMKGLKVGSIIGGIPAKVGTKISYNNHIIVGTPGKLKHLIKTSMINVENIRLFVLDEADKLMDSSFRDDIDEIFGYLPVNKQVITASATYPPDLQTYLSKYMRSPHYSSPSSDNPILIGVRQFVTNVVSHPNKMKQVQLKTEELIKIFEKIPFKQCLVFLNYQTRVQSVCNNVNKLGYSSTYISGNQDMSKRLDAISKLKNFECKVLFSTDLTARGIDAENVNLIINYDIPNDCSTYLHRIGRAGRYGSYGIAITLVAENELDTFKDMINPIVSPHLLLFKCPDYSESIWNTKIEDLSLFFERKESNGDFDDSEIHKNNEPQTNDINDEINTVDEFMLCKAFEKHLNSSKINNFKESDEGNPKFTQQVLQTETIVFLPIDEFIEKLYNDKMDILEINQKDKKVKCIINETQERFYEALFTKSSQFQTWNDTVIFPTCSPNVIDNDQPVDDTKINEFLNYQIYDRNFDSSQNKTEDTSPWHCYSHRYSIIKSRKLLSGVNKKLITCLERLFENLPNTSFNLEKNDRESCKKNILMWNKMLEHEIEGVNKLLNMNSLYIIDTGRKWGLKKYWQYLEQFLRFQKKMTDVIYFHFCNNLKFEDEYTTSKNQQNESIFSLLLNYILPRPIIFNKLLHELMSETDLKNYYDLRSNIHSLQNSYTQLLKLKECMFDFTKNERIKLEQQIKKKRKREDEISFKDLQEFLKQAKEKKLMDETKDTKNCENVNHFQEWKDVIDENSCMDDATYSSVYNSEFKGQNINSFSESDFFTQEYQYPPNMQYEHNYMPSFTSGIQNNMFEENGRIESEYVPGTQNHNYYTQPKCKPQKQNNHRNPTEDLDEFFRCLDIQTKALHLQEYHRLMMKD